MNDFFITANGSRLAEVAELEFQLLDLPTIVYYCITVEFSTYAVILANLCYAHRFNEL